MIKVIKRINPLQIAKVSGITYGFFSLVILLFGIIGLFIHSSSEPPSLIFVLMAVLYPVLGFVMGLAMAGVYNLAAGWVGGIEIEVEDKN